MRGIADGSKLSYQDILVTNFTSEVRSQVPSGCTSFVATREATMERQPIMGKTRDMASQMYFPFQIALKICESGKHEVFLAEAFSGMAATGCGMNECGLVVAVNTIATINDADDTVGVQRAFLARLALEECRNVEVFSSFTVCFSGN